MKKQAKVDLVKNLSEELKGTTSSIFVDYTGLSVKMQQELKGRLSEVGGKMTVIKNTLIKRAGENAKYPKETLTDTVLSGQTALVITKDDPIAPLQVVAKFAKEFVSEAGLPIPQFKAGIVEGKFQDKTTLIALSKLPGKEVLYAQTVGAIAAPLYGIVSTLQGNIQKLLWILKSKAEKS